MFIERRKIWAGIIILALFAGSFFLTYFIISQKKVTAKKDLVKNEESNPTLFNSANSFPTLSMNDMKRNGCIADGILFGYDGKVNNAIKMINRSQCKYLHRAIETWLQPPDFKEAEDNKEKITKDGMIYGMFIAEAIDKKADYFYPTENRDFEFAEMCRPGSDNFWGEHTCKPYFKREEYRKYLRHITEKAMDMGVRSFLFGQIFYQDTLSDPIAPQIIQEMREYADFKGIKIAIGAQTNDITDEKYLRLFDYIEGGTGINEEGKVEEGPCFSRWWKKEGDWCWGLLWNDRFSSKANNVFLHLDWSGKIGDDMSIFTRMDKDKRAKTLNNLYNYFTSRGDGFLMPMLAVLQKQNGGCYGDKPKYYSADNRYSCQDEDTENRIMQRR